MNPFNWIRRKVAESVVQGMADGLRAVTPEGEEPPADLGELRALLGNAIDVKALPAAEEPEPSSRKKGR